MQNSNYKIKAINLSLSVAIAAKKGMIESKYTKASKNAKAKSKQ